ncbi:N/A [soil metagenome]
MRSRNPAVLACMLLVLGGCERPAEEAAPPLRPVIVEKEVPPAITPAAVPTESSTELTLNDPSGQQVATVQLREQAEGVMIVLRATGLPSGQNGFHFHQIGRCNGPTFETAGDHFNPTRRQHGFDNPRGPHLGDLPNLMVQPDGTATQSLLARDVTLAPGARSVRGRALVVHAGRDDHRTDPSGNSGERIACGVVPAR